MSSNKTVIGFDLYGTILSTESIAKELASHFGDEKANTIATVWRRYQLEYTWRLNSMKIYKDFSSITLASLKHALAEAGEAKTLEEKDITSLMKAYDSLGLFPDVEAGLKALQSNSNITSYVFSNGTYDMVSSSVNQSPALEKYKDVFKDLITVEEPKLFKPEPKVYQHLAKRVDKEVELKDVWLVSGNPFDVVGARAVGMQAAWVDRAGNGWIDGLSGLMDQDCTPTLVVDGVEGAVKGIEEWVKAHGN